MGERIDQFCENLRIKLKSIDNNMQELKAKIDSKAQTAEQEVRTQLETVKKRAQPHPLRPMQRRPQLRRSVRRSPHGSATWLFRVCLSTRRFFRC